MALQGAYVFTQSVELSALESERQRTIDDQTAGSQILPMAEHDTDQVEWEIRDNVGGLMFVRDEGRPLPTRNEPGVKRYAVVPGIFGEQRTVPEQKLRSKRVIGDLGAAINVDDELSMLQQDLAIQANWTMEYIRWRLLCLGSVTVAKQDGTVVEVARLDNWATIAPAVPWTTVATAVPLQFIADRVAAYVGLGYDFGPSSKLFMNFVTLQYLYNNTNANDLFGKRQQFGATINSLADLNQILLQRGLPVIQIVEDSYVDTSGVAQRMIPDGYVVHVGNHWAMGMKAGEFVLTRNGIVPNHVGIYAANGYLPVEPKLPYTVRAFNGGPRLNYPNQVKVYKVN